MSRALHLLGATDVHTDSLRALQHQIDDLREDTQMLLTALRQMRDHNEDLTREVRNLRHRLEDHELMTKGAHGQ